VNVSQYSMAVYRHLQKCKDLIQMWMWITQEIWSVVFLDQDWFTGALQMSPHIIHTWDINVLPGRRWLLQCAYMYNVIVTQTVIKTCFIHRFHTAEQYSKIGLAYSLKADVINLLIPVFLTQSNELAVCLITHVIDVRWKLQNTFNSDYQCLYS